MEQATARAQEEAHSLQQQLSYASHSLEQAQVCPGPWKGLTMYWGLDTDAQGVRHAPACIHHRAPKPSGLPLTCAGQEAASSLAFRATASLLMSSSGFWSSNQGGAKKQSTRRTHEATHLSGHMQPIAGSNVRNCVFDCRRRRVRRSRACGLSSRMQGSRRTACARSCRPCSCGARTQPWPWQLLPCMQCCGDDDGWG